MANDILLDLLKMLEEKSEGLESLFGCGNWLDDEISLLWDVITDHYGCDDSDKINNALYDFGLGKLSKSKLLKLLTPTDKS